jgi:hypothetical protein
VVGVILHPNTAMMLLNKDLAQIQAQSQAQIKLVLDSSPFATIKAFPEMLLFLDWNAWSFVANRDPRSGLGYR